MAEQMTDFINEIDPDMSWPDYLAFEGVNPSRLVHGLKSMKSFQSYAGSDKPDRGMIVGSATHLLIFEPDKFDDRYAIFDGRRSERTKAWQMFTWKYPGKEAIKPDEYEQASRTAEAVRSDPLAMDLIRSTKTEVSLFCEDFGLQCKGRVDGLGHILLDLKTTTNVEMRAFGRVFATLNYGVKLACYKRWAEKLGNPVSEVFVVAVETKGEFDVAVIPVPEIVLENAWSKAEQVLKRIPQCMADDHWPGVAEGRLYELCVPNWSMDEEDVLDWSGVNHE